MGDERTFYVVDEDRVAVVAGPFDDQDVAADDARERAPGHIVVAKRALDMIEMSSDRTIRWENTEDDVDVVTDGGVVPKDGDRPDEVPTFWDELSLAGKRIYLEEDASKNEALILVVHELGLDIDTDEIDTSDSLVHTDALGEVLSEIVATNEVVHHLPDRDDVRIQADEFLDEDGEDDDTDDADDDVDGGNNDDVDGAGEEAGVESDSSEEDDAVPERSVAEDLQEQVAEEDDDSPWVRDAFADANNLGDSVITRLEDAGYSRVADLEAATEEELKENVSYVGRNKAKRIIGLVEEYTGDGVDDVEDDPAPEEGDEEELEEADEGDEDEGGPVEPADFEELDTPAWLDESSFYHAAEISDDLADFESTLGWDEGHERLAELVEATGVDVEVSI
ncbi:hypothetical protein DJ71_18570 [Halorubrum sp. E3]|nr:hypothetical protein DJ71_18570 [Halorubrum sp. E3]